MKAFNLVEAGARVCLLALIAICIPFGDVVRAEATNSTDTTSGPVVGLPADAKGVRAFLGIPYAEPPTGERRFRPPAPVKRSSTPIEATHFGNACAQRSDGEDPAEFGSFVDENCLTLNVWSPSDRGHLPVMVWIHGGGNSQGSSREPAYNGARLAARGKVVVVSLNYRLGIFGFVDISVLGGPRYKESCNDGLLDQLEALRWVKENIAGFGGDPGNVTVFGNSAGGVDISALLAMRSPEHFFHRAIIQSGFAGSVKSLAAARRFSGDIFGRAHVKSVAQLLAMTPEALLAMQAEALKAMSELESDGSFQASVDGTLLKEFPIDAIRKGSAKEIDLLLGTTANELRLYLTWNPEWKEAHLDDLPIVRDLPETTRNQLWNIYRKARPNMADGLVTLDILGDVVFRAGELRMAEEQLPYNRNVYVYLFNWQSSSKDLGAPHAIELPFVFGNESVQSQQLGDLIDPTNKKVVDRVVDAVQNYWTAFAATGVPVSPDGPAWPRYEPHSRQTMVFDRKLAVLADPMAEERKALSNLDLRRR